jgi:hypothetical protein
MPNQPPIADQGGDKRHLIWKGCNGTSAGKLFAIMGMYAIISNICTRMLKVTWQRSRFHHYRLSEGHCDDFEQAQS